ncbi:hypothetical protein ACFE04_005327 [Oxalis oulophora]
MVNEQLSLIPVENQQEDPIDFSRSALCPAKQGPISKSALCPAKQGPISKSASKCVSTETFLKHVTVPDLGVIDVDGPVGLKRKAHPPVLAQEASLVFTRSRNRNLKFTARKKGHETNNIEAQVNNQGSSSDCEDHQSNEETIKTCIDCGTSKTPLWRGGPAGPKSLCNACGIRSRKKRRAILGINNNNIKKSSVSITTTTTSTTKKLDNNNNNNNNSNNNNYNGDLKQRLIAIGREVLMKRSTVEKQRRKRLREEEQAAVLLMALSYGSVVYA